MNGRICEVGLWDVALNAAEMAMLGDGVCPLFIRRDNLVAYWPLIGKYSPEIDLIGGNNLTVTGATAADHCRVYRPSKRKVVAVPSGGAPPSVTGGRPLVNAGLVNRGLVNGGLVA